MDSRVYGTEPGLCAATSKNSGRVRPVCKDAGDNCFEVLVPESEIEQAHEIIIENGF